MSSLIGNLFPLYFLSKWALLFFIFLRGLWTNEYNCKLVLSVVLTVCTSTFQLLGVHNMFVFETKKSVQTICWYITVMLEVHKLLYLSFVGLDAVLVFPHKLWKMLWLYWVTCFGIKLLNGITWMDLSFLVWSREWDSFERKCSV